MTIIQCGISNNPLLTVDTTSNAMRAIQYGSNGIAATNIGKATYTCSMPFSAAPVVGDFFILYGSDSKTTYITKMWISMTQTTAAVIPMTIQKRLSPGIGTPSSYNVPVALDSNFGIATAVCAGYSVAQTTAGLSGGVVWQGWVNSPAPGVVAIGQFPGIIIDFIDLYGKPIALHSDLQSVAFNLAAVGTGLTVLAGVQWIEE